MKNKQTFGYAIIKDGELMSVGSSRSWDLQTLRQLRPDADYADPATPLVRVPEQDQITTEYGFMSRQSYLEIKNNQK
jgi:hypothetical protein